MIHVIAAQCSSTQLEAAPCRRRHEDTKTRCHRKAAKKGGPRRKGGRGEGGGAPLTFLGREIPASRSGMSGPARGAPCSPLRSRPRRPTGAPAPSLNPPRPRAGPRPTRKIELTPSIIELYPRTMSMNRGSMAVDPGRRIGPGLRNRSKKCSPRQCRSRTLCPPRRGRPEGGGAEVTV